MYYLPISRPEIVIPPLTLVVDGEESQDDENDDNWHVDVPAITQYEPVADIKPGVGQADIATNEASKAANVDNVSNNVDPVNNIETVNPSSPALHVS